MANIPDDEKWLSVESAAHRLNLSRRQMYRYASRVRTQKIGQRILFHAEDLDEIARELGIFNRAVPPRPPKAEVMPVGEMLDYLRQRDSELEQVQVRLEQALIELGSARQDAQRRQFVDQELSSVRQELSTVQEERDQLRIEIATLRPINRWLKNSIIVLAVFVVILLLILVYFLINSR